MPHHNAWQIFCQPEVRQCCKDDDSFLRPGRRQCLDSDELPELMLRYVERLWRVYSRAGAEGAGGAEGEGSTPRMGLVRPDHDPLRISAR
jgi:hypothetical protein